MIKDFVHAFPEFKVIAVLAEALSGESKFVDQVRRLTKAQVISQLK